MTVVTYTYIMEIHKECRYLYGGLYGKVFSIIGGGFFS